MEHVWKVWIAVASTMTALYYLVSNTPANKLFLYNGVGLLAVAAVVFGVKKNRLEDAAAWLWLAAGMASFVIADVVYYLLERSGPPPFPSLADAFYLGMYPLIAIAFTKMTPADHKRGFVEGIAVATAAAAALWIFYVDDMLGFGLEGNQRVVSLAYPLMGILLVGAATRLAVVRGLGNPRIILVGAAVASLTVADTAYNIYLNNGTFKTGLFIDLFWIAFFALVAVAALIPFEPAQPVEEPAAVRPTAPTAREIASVLS